MSVYNVSGNTIDSLYSVNGASVLTAYDIAGDIVFTSWYDEITIEEKRDTTVGTTYYVTRIPQTRPNGTKQYPFVYAPNGTGAALYSTLSMNRLCGFYLAANAGVFNMPSSGQYTPIGTIVQNSVVVKQGSKEGMEPFNQNQFVLTVNNAGVLGYAAVDASASGLVSSGIVSAVHAFCPVVIDFQDAYEITHDSYLNNSVYAQRQVIGQFANGDYVFITCEGRGFNDSEGFTMPDIRRICLDMGLKFAFNLDGGGSTETVIGNEQINTIYEGTYGRKVPTYIVFNGTDEFFVPSEVIS